MLRQAVGVHQLAHHPRLLDGLGAAAHVELPRPHERVGLGALQVHRGDDVDAQRREGAHATVAIDEHEASGLVGEDEHGLTLPMREQRRGEAGLTCRVDYAQRLIPKLDLVSLDLHREAPDHRGRRSGATLRGVPRGGDLVSFMRLSVLLTIRLNRR